MKIKNLFYSLIGVTVILSSCNTKTSTISNVEIETRLDTVSYMIGADVASNIKSSGVSELNEEAFMNGLTDVFADKDLKIDKTQIRATVSAYIMDIRKEIARKNLEEGQEFLEKNKKKDGIIVTESGLQYEIIEEGTGISPRPVDAVEVHYTGTLIDGTKFDSSYDRGKPSEFGVAQVIKGWTEGLMLMKEGAKYKFYIPSELAYGESGSRSIQPNSTLIFEVELLKVKPLTELSK